MTSLLYRDSNTVPVQLMVLSAPQTLAVKAIADVATATLSGAIAKKVIRVQCTVDTWLVHTVTNLVTAATGHYLAAAACYDLVVPEGTTKISVVAVGTVVGVCYLSELG